MGVGRMIKTYISRPDPIVFSLKRCKVWIQEVKKKLA
jgi:hypothetical protein